MDKIDKEVIYWSIWKLIQYIYGISLILAVCTGVLVILNFLNGTIEEKLSLSGTIIVGTISIFVIILRNLLKPFFRKKTNDYME